MRAPSPNKRPREDDGGAPSTMFGDIGGGGEASIDTRDDVPVSSFTPLQRVVLSANGNLQRIVSSYYNAPVVVEVVRNDRVEEGMFNRLVCLKLHDIVFGVAHSTVVITDEAALEAVERDGVAVGQLFRHLNMMPSFSLHAADFSEAAHAVAPMAKLLREFQEDAAAQLGAAFQEDAAAQLGAVALGPGSRRESRAEAATHLGEKPTFWREYTLKGRGVVCSIRETLLLDMFDLAADAASATAFADDAAPTFGDIMSPTMTGLQLPDGFSPLERLLLTANGNIERIVSSYYAQPVTAYVMENHKRQDAVYDRKARRRRACRQRVESPWSARLAACCRPLPRARRCVGGDARVGAAVHAGQVDRLPHGSLVGGHGGEGQCAHRPAALAHGRAASVQASLRRSRPRLLLARLPGVWTTRSARTTRLRAPPPGHGFPCLGPRGGRSSLRPGWCARSTRPSRRTSL